MKPTKSTEVGRTEIARLAYLLWEQNGRPEGRDQFYWLEAEKQLAARQTSVAESVPAKAASTATKRKTPVRRTKK